MLTEICTPISNCLSQLPISIFSCSVHFNIILKSVLSFWYLIALCYVFSCLFSYCTKEGKKKKLNIRKKIRLKEIKRTCLPWKRSWIRYQPDPQGVLYLFSFYLASATSHCRCCVPTVTFPTIRNTLCTKQSVALLAQSVQRLTTGWKVRDRIPMGTRFSAHSDRPWGAPSLL